MIKTKQKEEKMVCGTFFTEWYSKYERQNTMIE